jgi:dephospho-CoA kinase
VDQKLERKKLGAIVFGDEQALLDLNAITHGAIKAEIVRRLAEKPALAAIDAIALFEGGLAELCDTTVAVCAPAETRVARLIQRDGITREYAENRIRAQKSESWFRSMCDHTLYNDGTWAEFEEQCRAFLDEIVK